MIVASAAVAVEVVPEAGGKIAALRHREREWLLAPVDGRPAPPRYGAAFTAGPLWGWDEMLPTIEPCGDLPDHGEVWAFPWTSVCRDGRLSCAVEGRARPYRLVRSLEVREATVVLEYRLTATERLDVLWAAHPQFVLDPAGTAVLLPPGTGELVDVSDGSRVSPAALEDPLGLVPAGAGRKLYADPDARIGTVRLVDRGGSSLSMTWDPDRLPYLGIWIDHGAHAHRPVIAIEPANGYYDSLERATALGRAAEVAPGRPLRWGLTVEAGS
jgi:galactose mutarotase-like enzyme